IILLDEPETTYHEIFPKFLESAREVMHQYFLQLPFIVLEGSSAKCQRHGGCLEITAVQPEGACFPFLMYSGQAKASCKYTNGFTPFCACDPMSGAFL